MASNIRISQSAVFVAGVLTDGERELFGLVGKEAGTLAAVFDSIFRGAFQVAGAR